MASTHPPSSPRSASPAGVRAPEEKRQSNIDACELQMFLEAHKLNHYVATLLDHGYTLSTLDLLTPADLRKLRITNRGEVEKLVGLGMLVGVQKERFRKRERDERAAATESDELQTGKKSSNNASCDHALQHRHATLSSDHSVLTPTANECCRQATNFIDYRRIDRAWPLPSSALTRSLGLSTARPDAGSSLLYELLMAPKVYPHPPLHGKASVRRIVASPTAAGAAPPTDEGAATAAASGSRGRPREVRWAHVNQRNPTPPEMPSYTPRVVAGGVKRVWQVSRQRSHSHGVSARSCPVCEDHVKGAEMRGLDGGSAGGGAPGVGSDGQWQYQVAETLLLGDGKVEAAKAWRAFEPVESMKLEYAFKKKHPGVVISGKYADFATMLWGGAGVMSRSGSSARKRSVAGHNPIRRSATAAVNFPSLKEKEVVPTPPEDSRPQRLLELELATSFLRLCETEEQRARIGITHAHTAETSYLVAQIHAMMLELFAVQRLRLEDQEARARRSIEEELLEVALDKLWDEAEKSVRKIAYDAVTTDVRRSSSNVVFQQYDIMREIEASGRRHLVDQEAAERANLDLLMAKFNEELRRLQRRAAAGADASARRKRFQVSNYADGCVTRCAVCKSKDCVFFKHPWRGTWRQRGGVLDLDLDMRSHMFELREVHHNAQMRLDKTCGGIDAKYHEAHGHVLPAKTVAGLVARANEKEYEEFQSVRRAERETNKFRNLQATAAAAPTRPSTRFNRDSDDDEEAVDFGPLQPGIADSPYSPPRFRQPQPPSAVTELPAPAAVALEPRRPHTASGGQRPPFKVGRPHTPL